VRARTHEGARERVELLDRERLEQLVYLHRISLRGAAGLAGGAGCGR
jgi:hypothetical protein